MRSPALQFSRGLGALTMFHNGYLVHPDIWMLWFSFFVASAVTLNYVVTIIAKVLDKWLGPR